MSPIGYTHSENGVLWADAPLPRRWHRCYPQTIGAVDGVFFSRCPCGAIRQGGVGRKWRNRNSRRRSR